MRTFLVNQAVVYQPGFRATNLSEEGRSLPDRLRRVVHGVVESVNEKKGEVFIRADNGRDSGLFPFANVEPDYSEAPLF